MGRAAGGKLHTNVHAHVVQATTPNLTPKKGGVLLTVDEIKEKRKRGKEREERLSDPHTIYLHRCDETGGVFTTVGEIK